MDNNFFGDLFRPQKKPGKETASSLPELYPTREFRRLESWINSPSQSINATITWGKSGTDYFLDLLLSQLPERNALVKIWYKK
jgi:hypothetical protein